MEIYQKIKIRQLAVSTQESRYLLSCNGQHYEVNLLVVKLLQILQEETNEWNATSRFLKEEGQGKYTQEQVTEAIAHYIQPLLLESKKEKKTFLYQRELLSANDIDKFSDRFSFLFHRSVMLPILLLSLLADFYFFFKSSNLLEFNNQLTIYTAVGILLFIVFSSFIHEIGHASSCKHFGVKHGGIGFGLYLNFPVLYTDVSDVWTLSRVQRCVVNLASVYFQCFCLLVLLALYFATQNDIVRYLILTINLSFLMTLNPFFKFDGYWLASDLLGVPNLRQRSKEWIDYLYKRFRKQSTTTLYLLTINKLERYCLLLYSILVNLFMGYYFLYIIPMFLYNFIKSFPQEVESLTIYLSNRVVPPFVLLRNIGSQVLFLALIVLLLVNIICPLVKKYAKNK